jgi:transcriptional regulator with XRE-family HTH domain
MVPPPPLDWTLWRARVQALKEARGLSINTITERSGLDRSTVIELLGGRRGVEGVRIDTMWALAWALEVTSEGFPAFVAPLTDRESQGVGL